MKKKKIKKALKDTLVVVSGIPRSGTSLMMQMLKAGGLDVLSDHQREPDENNPKGYLELTAVKSLDKDNSCLKGETGKAVKVISHLLKYVPEDQDYKVIFVNRNMSEILRSQEKMIGKEENRLSKVLIKAFTKELKEVKEWAKERPNIEVLNVNYRKIIEKPSKQIQKIIDFLGIPLDKEKMERMIDPSLYRNRIVNED
ncbi:MAG: sulfotransferase family protein [Candidatus Lokiarchaeota archaeon]|nr:sulfotransferase family protein [Candidatus Lokiarchaeota archaeon]